MPVPHSHRARGWGYTLLLIALLSAWIPLRAQYFPVQGSLQIRRPYSLYLNDYALPSREAIVITLTNRDIQHPALQVRLRLRIKNTACLIQTREESYFAPIDLQVNFPVRLTSADLQEYFTPQNLGGYGLRGDKLPDGYTEFAVQVVDVFTGAPLSDWISTTLFLESLKPPELLLPQHEEKIEYRMPQQILFQWYPRHQAMSRTTYEFVLKELPDNGAPAPAAFPYGNEIYRTECVTPSLLFSGDEALLVPNQRYAWQVRAIIHDGLDQLGIFENEGRSEVFGFTLTENCPAPLYLKSTPGYARADLSWRIEPRARGYVVAYRPKSAKEDYFEWKTETCDNTHYSLRGLRLGWTYEWRVGSLCSGETPVYSSIAEFTLSSQNEQLLANCGKKPPEGKGLSNTPKLDLAVGDQVIIGGDFPMRITALENLGDGWYAGQGITELRAIISVSNIALRFDRLRVNTEGYQIDGTVESVYDKGQTNIANADQIDDGGQTLRNVELRIRKQHLDFPLPTNPVVHYNPETQQLEIEDEAGKVHNVPLSLPQNESYQSIFPFVITDANGNRYSLTPEDENRSEEGREGKQQPTGKQRLIVQRLERVGLFNGNKLITEYGTMRFTRGKGLYAFDDGVTATKYFLRGSTKLDSYYTPLEKSYTVAWKLVPVGTSDVVEALWDGKKQHKEINPKRVKFVQVTGETLPTLYDSVQKSWRITLPSVQANESYELFALLDGDLVGKLRVASYPRQTHRVTLVTLENGKKAEKSKSQQAIDLEELQRALDAIYAPVGVQIELTEQRLLLPQGARWDLDGDGLLSLEGTNFWGQTKDVKESAEMLALQRLFKQHGQYDANGTYLFVLPAGKSGEKGGNILGDMPRGSRFGYLFTGDGKLSTRAFARQIAHELGHGLFTLQHSIDAEYGNKRSLGKTDNLMDYTETGTVLLAFQWNIMGSPALITAFDKAEEGRLFKQGSAFLTPDWTPFICNTANALAKYAKPSDNSFTNGVVGVIYLKSGQKRYSYREHNGRQGFYDENGNPLTDIIYPTLSENDSVYVINYNDTIHPCGMIYRMRWGDIKTRRAEELFTSTSLARTPIKALRCASEEDDSLVLPLLTIHFTQGTRQYRTELRAQLEAAVSHQATLNMKEASKRPLLYFLLEGEKVNYDSLRQAHPNELVICYTVGRDKEDKPYIKELLAENKSVNLVLKSLYQNFKLPFEKATAVAYTVLDLLSRGLESLKIPEEVWACGAPTNVFKQAVAICYDIYFPFLFTYGKEAKWSENFEFAFACGLWDGVVETIKGVPDLMKMLLSIFSLDTASKVQTQVKSFQSLKIIGENGDVICDTADYLCKVRELFGQLVNSITNATRCDVAHTVGELVVPIIITVLSEGAAAKTLAASIGNLESKLSWTLRNALRFLKWCDDYGDVMTYAQKLGRLNVRLVKKASGELMPELQLNGKTLVKNTGQKQYAIVRSLEETEEEVVKCETPEELNGRITKLLEGGEGGALEAILRCLPNVNSRLTEAIRQLDGDLRAKLLYDLEKHSQRKNLITLLESPEDLEIWKVIKNDPHAGFDELQQYKGEHRKELRKWTRSEYFKAVSNEGKVFGQNVVSDLRKEESFIRKKLEALLGKDLSDYEVYDEVQLFIDKTNDEYMKADIVLVKWDANEENIIDFIVVENKISPKSPYSDNQKQFFDDVLKKIKGNKKVTIDVRSNKIKNINDNIIKKVDRVQIDLVKITGGGSESIEDLEKIAVERILHVDL